MPPEERRAGYVELLDSIKELKQDMKEHIKEVKDEIREQEKKAKDLLDVNNKFYFNGFQPDKHVADHHIIDNIIEKLNEGKTFKNKILEEVIKAAVVAIFTYIAVSTWSNFKQDVQPPFETPHAHNETQK